MIVVPAQRIKSRQPELQGKNALVEGGRQLLMKQRTNLRRSNRLQLATEGRRLLGQTKDRSTNLNSCDSMDRSVASGIGSFTWNMLGVALDNNIEQMAAGSQNDGDEESMIGVHSKIASVATGEEPLWHSIRGG